MPVHRATALRVALAVGSVLVAAAAWWSLTREGEPEDARALGRHAPGEAGPSGSPAVQPAGERAAAARAPAAGLQASAPPARLSLSGRVVDTRDEPRARHIVVLVPDGSPAPKDPRRWLELPHARTSESGAFALEVPSPEGATDVAAWRPFVGYSGEILLESPDAISAGIGGAREVEIVVPAATRLIVDVRASEAPGSTAARAFGVSVYRLGALLDVEQPLPPQVAPDQAPIDRRGKDEDELAEIDAAVRDEEVSRADPTLAALARLRASVVPVGWRAAKSAFAGANGRIVFEGLPVGEELRFAVSSPPEAFRVEGAASLPPSGEAHVQITVPAPLSEAEFAALPDLRSVVLKVLPVRPTGAPREPGFRWRRDG